VSGSFTFLTKDKDFASLSIAWGAPPKVILLQTDNCSTATIERIIPTMPFVFQSSGMTPGTAYSF
jgi:predicted nuclease of predicted toxin-antitoxin system